MLVLTRKIGECVSVPCCDVTIEVLRISRSQVRLGVTAPRDTEVHRSEILERPCRSHRSATARRHRPGMCRVEFCWQTRMQTLSAYTSDFSSPEVFGRGWCTMRWTA